MKLRKLKANKAIKKKIGSTLQKALPITIYKYVLWKGRGKTGVFQNSAKVNGDYEVRDLAQGKNREA